MKVAVVRAPGVDVHLGWRIQPVVATLRNAAGATVVRIEQIAVFWEITVALAMESSS
jgi:hypothetical protein